MRVVIYGSRRDGHAKVLVDLLSTTDLDPEGLIDDQVEHGEHTIRGLAVLGTASVLRDLVGRGIEGLVIGFGSGPGRRAAIATARDAGLALPTVVHPSAVVSASASIGDGVQVLAHAYMGPDVVLHAGALVNTGAIVEHDTELGDGAVVGPGAVLAGRVRVGAAVEIGAGATVLPDRSIGAGACVGAGAVVTRDVAAGTTVVGVPARERPGE
jgi:sugar O-acyltransferase (sialic acid O-acetyltransferase NeuD family)